MCCVLGSSSGLLFPAHSWGLWDLGSCLCPCVGLVPLHVPPCLIHSLTPILVYAAGLMIRPKTENLDVIVNVSDTESWDQHVQKLNKFLEREWRAKVDLGDPASQRSRL